MSSITETMGGDNQERETILEVSEESYRQKLAAGQDPDAVLTPGTHRFRRARRIIKPDETVIVNGKVRVTLYLDGDIVEHFRHRGPHYQTEINRALREIVATENYAATLLSDEFVDKLAARLSGTLDQPAA